MFLQASNSDVVLDAQIYDQPVLFSVLRNEGDSMVDRFFWVSDLDGIPVYFEAAREGAVYSKNASQEFGAAASHEASETNNLSSFDF